MPFALSIRTSCPHFLFRLFFLFCFPKQVSSCVNVLRASVGAAGKESCSTTRFRCFAVFMKYFERDNGRETGTDRKKNHPV